MDHRPRENIDGCTEEGVYYGNSASGDFTQANADNVSFPSGTSGSDYPIEVFRRDYFYDTPSGQQDASGQTNIRGRLSYTEVFGINANQERFTSYSYDNMGRIDWKVIWGSALYYPKKTTYTYDLQSDLTQRGFIDQDWRTYPFYWNYSYDTAGRLDNAFNGLRQQRKPDISPEVWEQHIPH